MWGLEITNSFTSHIHQPCLPFPDKRGRGSDRPLPQSSVVTLLVKMSSSRRSYTSSSKDPSFPSSSTSGSGICMMSSTWKEEQHQSFINFISSFLNANSYRLNILPIAPDFIFNNGGLSVAFIFITNWECDEVSPVFSRIQNLKRQFRHFYVVVTLPTREQNDSFVSYYFKYGMELGKPTFVPVKDLEMGFEKIVKIAHVSGVCKQQDLISRLTNERKQLVLTTDTYLKVVMSIPGIDYHDANALLHAIGSIEAIAKASKKHILENTDLSAEKAETIESFFRDPRYYLSAKIS